MEHKRPEIDARSAASGVVSRAEPVLVGGLLDDLVLIVGGKPRRLWGRGGRACEERWPAELPGHALPVLLGPTLGRGLELFAASGRPVAVVDFEGAAQEATGARARFGGLPNVLWLDSGASEELLQRLERWRAEQGKAMLVPFLAPATRRLAPEPYTALYDALESGAKFWRQARQPRFQGAKPRILLLDSPYFLLREIKDALTSLEIPFATLPVPAGELAGGAFVQDLLRRALEFRPDFVLTVNHLGLDREGRLTELLDRLDLPLASWFVDSPQLVLSSYPGLAAPGVAVFTWDADTVPGLRARGFGHAHYLPLATDPRTFRPGVTPNPVWRGQVSFVGDSMARAVADNLRRCADFPWLTGEYEELARGFADSRARGVEEFFDAARPDLAAKLRSLSATERLGCEMLIVFEATRQYRWSCVTALAGFAPVVGGDAEGWERAFAPGTARLVGRLNYYGDLPGFYPACAVTLNCTSRQMKGAVNQRVFDVPACGGFVLTDGQEQLSELFEPGREVTIFESPEEIGEMLPRLLADGALRDRVSAAARRRILAEHTYEHRLRRLCSVMRETFEARIVARA